MLSLNTYLEEMTLLVLGNHGLLDLLAGVLVALLALVLSAFLPSWASMRGIGTSALLLILARTDLSPVGRGSRTYKAYASDC